MKESISHTSVEPLVDYFQKSLPLNGEEKELLRTSFHSRLFRKRQYVLQEGDICTQFNFVVQGCLRSYKVDEKGNIHVLQFAPENNWISDLGSFHEAQPTILNIDALEDTVVLQVNREDLIALYQKAPKFDRLFRVLIENGFVRLQHRLLQNISSTAEERYKSFLEAYPHLTNRLSQIQVAAYLGVTPEFLSRLRNSRKKAGIPKKS